MELLVIVVIIIYVLCCLLSPDEFKTNHKLNAGRRGEEYIFISIKSIFGEHRIFRNLYIPKANGQITEIDLLAIHQSGIYVFESKNYNGWIFGDSTQKNWMQLLKNGSKKQFYNPVWQNNTHIKAVQNNLSQYKNIIYHSYIVFSEYCTLKSITCDQLNVYILNLNYLQYSLKKTMSNSTQSLSEDDIEIITNFFSVLQHSSENLKEQHLKDVKNILTSCPYCKIALVERHNNKTGDKFYGCKNYPRCKYTTK